MINNYNKDNKVPASLPAPPPIPPRTSSHKMVAKTNTTIPFTSGMRKDAESIKKLREYCIRTLKESDPSTLLIAKERPEYESYVRTQTDLALTLAGASPNASFHSKKHSSKNEIITDEMINEAQRLSSCSPIRLAYEFLAREQDIPTGYIDNILKPAMIAYMTTAGFDTRTAVKVTSRILKNCGIRKESQLFFESFIEIKRQIRHHIQEKFPQHQISFGQTLPQETTQLPSVIQLDPPQMDTSHYRCDADDLWMIEKQVDHSRKIRLAGDYAKRAKRWAGRNKRRFALYGSVIALQALLMGLLSGGIAAAVAAVSSLGSFITMFIFGALYYKIRCHFMEKKLHAIPEEEQKSLEGKTFDKYQQSMTYLCSVQQLSDIMNAYKNFTSSFHQLEKLRARAEDSATDFALFKKQKRILELRRKELQEKFGDDDSIFSFDQLMVHSVEKLSAFDEQFEHALPEIMQPFLGIPQHQTMEIFEDTALHKDILRNRMKLRLNNQKWVQERLLRLRNICHSPDVRSQLLHVSSPTVLNDPDENQSAMKFARVMRVSKHVIHYGALTVATTIKRLLLQISGSMSSSILGADNTAITSAIAQSLRSCLFLHRLGPLLVVDLFYFFASRVTEATNHLVNSHTVNKWATATRQDQEEQQSTSSESDTPLSEEHNSASKKKMISWDYEFPEKNLDALYHETQKNITELSEQMKKLHALHETLSTEIESHQKLIAREKEDIDLYIKLKSMLPNQPKNIAKAYRHASAEEKNSMRAALLPLIQTETDKVLSPKEIDKRIQKVAQISPQSVVLGIVMEALESKEDVPYLTRYQEASPAVKQALHEKISIINPSYATESTDDSSLIKELMAHASEDPVLRERMTRSAKLILKREVIYEKIIKDLESSVSHFHEQIALSSIRYDARLQEIDIPDHT